MVILNIFRRYTNRKDLHKIANRQTINSKCGSMSIVGVVLCGGIGKRLRPLTYYFQKTMIPIGTRQKPVLEHIVRLFRFHRIRDIIFLVNYKAEQIKNYFEDGKRFGVNIQYVSDNPDLGGNAGAVLNACDELKIQSACLIYYGDILSNLNLSGLINEHKKKKASGTIALAKGYRERVGVAQLGESNEVVGFVEKPILKHPVNVGISLFEYEVLNHARNKLTKKRNLDLYSDIVPLLIKEKSQIFGYFDDNLWWYDVGSTSRFEKLENSTVDKWLNHLFEVK